MSPFWIVVFVSVCFFTAMPSGFAADNPDEDEKVKSSSVRNVGGLLFDMDEGVEIEEGPGGSVYVKSNREQMQARFSEIDRKFEDLYYRLEALEDMIYEGKSPKSDSKDESESGVRGRVLSA